jgi:hypothetical protein
MNNIYLKNKQIASLYFGKYNLLLAVLERTDNCYNLQYIKKLNNILDLKTFSLEDSETTINEISQILSQFSISGFFVTLNPDYYIVAQIPGCIEKNKDEFLKLVNLSIEQHYSNKDINDFRIKSIPINSVPPMEFVTIINNDIIIAIKNLIAMFECEIIDINPEHISAINSFNFNYPEKNTETIILVQLLNNILEFIIISNNQILGFTYSILEKDIPVSKIVENELSHIAKNYNLKDINCIYFYGDKLNKQEYLDYWKAGMIISQDCRRLNPFRLINSNLEKRDKDYCIHMFQMYVLCIGGALPIQINMSVF